MKVIYGLGALKARDTALAIGIFDGVHRGHQALITKMVRYAHRRKKLPAVMTFFPHPAHVLRPDLKLAYLMSLDERLRQLSLLGVERVYIIPFNKAFARIDARSFVQTSLKRRLGASAVFVGEDFRFGKDRKGGPDLFKESGLYVCALKPVELKGEIISSTRVRRLIAEGAFAQVKQLLGRPYTLEGRVVKGEARGRLLGFATANLDCGDQLMVPHGVYAVRVRLGDREYPGMANVGLRPSFKDKNPSTHLEVHLFDFNRRIYGRKLTVHFIKRTRDERRFSSLDALKRQISRDELMIRRLLKVE